MSFNNFQLKQEWIQMKSIQLKLHSNIYLNVSNDNNVNNDS